MAAPGIGFSFGDIIAGIELAIKAAKAVQDSNGAVAQYQQAVVELNLLSDVFKRAKALQCTRSTSENVEKIHLCAYACSIPLSRFAQRVAGFSKYFDDTGVSQRKPKEWIVATGRKVHWALAVEKELAKLRAGVQPQMLAMMTLLQLEDAARAADLQADITKCLHATEAASEKTELLQDYVCQSLTNKFQPTTTLSSDVIDITTRQERLLSTQTRQHYEALGMLRRIHEAVTADGTAIRREHDLFQAPPKLDLSMPASSAQIFMKMRGPRYEPARSAIVRSTQLKTTLKAGQQEEEVVALFLALTTAIWKSLSDKLMVLLLMLPPIQEFLRHLTKCAPAPVLPVQDLIFLEDALGRAMKLDYAYFQDWPTLNAMLRFRFKGCPGEALVTRGEFELLELAQTRVRRTFSLNEDLWSQMVKPGSKVLMAMLRWDAISSDSICPQCSSDCLTVGKGDWFLCAACDNSLWRKPPKMVVTGAGEFQHEHDISDGSGVLNQPFKNIRTYGLGSKNSKKAKNQKDEQEPSRVKYPGRYSSDPVASYGGSGYYYGEHEYDDYDYYEHYRERRIRRRNIAERHRRHHFLSPEMSEDTFWYRTKSQGHRPVQVLDVYQDDQTFVRTRSQGHRPTYEINVYEENPYPYIYLPEYPSRGSRLRDELILDESVNAETATTAATSEKTRTIDRTERLYTLEEDCQLDVVDYWERQREREVEDRKETERMRLYKEEFEREVERERIRRSAAQAMERGGGYNEFETTLLREIEEEEKHTTVKSILAKIDARANEKQNGWK